MEARPVEIDEWINRHRPDKPPVVNVATFLRNWKLWYTALQPGLRQSSKWPLNYNLERLKWGHLLGGGKSGFFLVVVSLSWAVRAQDGVRQRKDVSGCIEEVTWCLRMMTEALVEEGQGIGEKRKGGVSTAGSVAKKARV